MISSSIEALSVCHSKKRVPRQAPPTKTKAPRYKPPELYKNNQTRPMFYYLPLRTTRKEGELFILDFFPWTSWWGWWVAIIWLRFHPSAVPFLFRFPDFLFSKYARKDILSLLTEPSVSPSFLPSFLPLTPLLASYVSKLSFYSLSFFQYNSPLSLLLFFFHFLYVLMASHGKWRWRIYWEICHGRRILHTNYYR